jgi:FeS assembly SUF system protein
MAGEHGPHPAPDVPAPASSGPGANDPLNSLKLRPLVIEALSSVFDPEIPVNIYELGLIYDIVIDADAVVTVRMTLTSPACPAAQSIPGEVERKIEAIAGVADARIEIVWEPPWTKERMSEAAKLQLGLW